MKDKERQRKGEEGRGSASQEWLPEAPPTSWTGLMGTSSYVPYGQATPTTAQQS